MRRTFQYKAKINKTTESNAIHWLNLCCSLYNTALEQRILWYKQWKKSISCYDQQKELRQLKKECPEFKIVNAQCLQDVTSRVDRAFQGFFRRLKTGKGKVGFPRFKSYNRYDSFLLSRTGWGLSGRYLDIRNVGRFKLFLDRPIQGTTKTITIRRTTTNEWFVSFSCNNVPEREFPETDKEVGIDVGLNHFCVDSEAEFTGNPRYFRRTEKLLRRRHRSLSRKKRGSERRKKARLLVAKAYEKVKNQRKDFLHKLSLDYIKKYSKIFVEDLNIKGMAKNKYLSKSINDASWSQFFNFLSYKAEEASRIVVKVPPENTSQMCSGCGQIVKKDLGVRMHYCPHCGLEIDRDLNAALNILRLGQSLQTLTYQVTESVV